MEALGHSAEHLAEAHRLRRRQAQSPNHLLLREVEQFANGRRRTEWSYRSGDVPAHVVVGRIDGVADAALHFRAKHQGVEEIGSGNSAILGKCENRRSDWPGRVDDGA
ncbi:MAG: hypothetical protein NTW28_07840 [Candidatus Solibacter sp.]|nr:hypothetical protein [Candidatus Solibacter sp.]